MIDWVTAEIDCNHPRELFGDLFMVVNRDMTEIKTRFSKFEAVKGSHDDEFYVKTTESDSHENPIRLRITGNPAKFLQRHNVFGSDNLVGLVSDVMEILIPTLGLTPTPEQIDRLHRGDYALTRVDVNYSYELPDLASVRAWLLSAQDNTRTRRGTALMTAKTLYWQKHSTRWTIKSYSKYDEITSKKKKHMLPYSLQNTGIKEFAENKLRVELTLRTPELDKHGKHRGYCWGSQTPKLLHSEYLKKIIFGGNMVATPKTLDSLPARLIAVYHLWLEGHDLRGMYPKNTYYRYRKELLKHGFDISIKQKDRPDMTNVVPLVRYLEAIPASTPEWAIGTELYHEPRKRYL